MLFEDIWYLDIIEISALARMMRMVDHICMETLLRELGASLLKEFT